MYFKYVPRLLICHGLFEFQYSFMERKRVRRSPEATQAFQLGEKHTSKNATVFMQETHSKQWEQLWRGSIKFSHRATSIMQRRLDYCFVSDSFQDSMHEVEILTGIQTDPIPIQCGSLNEE